MVIVIVNIPVNDAFHVGILRGLELNFAYRFQNAFITINRFSDISQKYSFTHKCLGMHAFDLHHCVIISLF